MGDVLPLLSLNARAAMVVLSFVPLSWCGLLIKQACNCTVKNMFLELEHHAVGVFCLLGWNTFLSRCALPVKLEHAKSLREFHRETPTSGGQSSE